MPPREQARAAFAIWFLVGTISISILQWSHAQATGGIGGLLKVGEDHPVAAMITAEVPGIPVAPGLGHDGQLYYSMGLDLTGRHIPEHFQEEESISYRYRRIGYPAVASLFGFLDGSALVWGMVVVNGLSVGIAAGATAAIAQHFRRWRWAAMAVVLNPGVWLSALLSTADNLALAAGLLAVLLFLKQRLAWTVAALAISILTKEVSLAFAFGLAGFCWWRLHKRREPTWLLLGSVGPLVLWLLFLQVNLGGAFDSAGNLSLPFRGLFESAQSWPEESLLENLLNGLVLVFMLVGAVGLFRRRPLWRWLVWPWIGIGAVSSHLIWDLGNNSIRVFAPVVILTILGLADEDPRRPSKSDSTRLPVESGIELSVLQKPGKWE